MPIYTTPQCTESLDFQFSKTLDFQFLEKLQGASLISLLH
uniref:Uncharacterized protein n=1 Tax=Arundo donax TaxID=35708 RepID=A0A0A9GSC0_ARUDO